MGNHGDIGIPFLRLPGLMHALAIVASWPHSWLLQSKGVMWHSSNHDVMISDITIRLENKNVNHDSL